MRGRVISSKVNPAFLFLPFRSCFSLKEYVETAPGFLPLTLELLVEEYSEKLVVQELCAFERPLIRADKGIYPSADRRIIYFIYIFIFGNIAARHTRKRQLQRCDYTFVI